MQIKTIKQITHAAISLMMMILITGQTFAQITVKADKKAETKEEYTYQTFENDPLNTRLYTLENGLKVYMTVFEDKPRVQTYIAVKAGSKHDPSETTGLAHYFEHIMFKGTSNFGTSNYEKEAPLIQEVSDLFEVYRKTKDEKKRKEIYSRIDSLSYEASKYGIPNEYDKLMSTIGAKGTNAFTSLEQTVYVNNIPSNQLDKFFRIESDRFQNVVIRGFHSELETIYEEKNMTMTSDDRKVFTALLEGIFQNHTYGTQTTIGTQEHIKNPSMKNIRWFHSNYYVPNNMAIALSGNFNPDEAIRIIDKHFGNMEPNNKIPDFKYDPEQPIKEPIVKEVLGPDAEKVMLGFRFDGANSKEADMLTMIDMILTNGEAGLIDLNLNQKQRVLEAGSSPMILEDYSMLMMSGQPKEGQTLNEVKNLLLEQIENIKNGAFDEWLMQAIINDLKLRETKRYESNNARAMKYVQSFIQGIPWEKELNKMDRLSKITKDDIIEFANEHFEENYVVVYKRVGKDTTIKKIKKNRITPIEMNRDKQSDFFTTITSEKTDPLEPKFIDYKEEIQQEKLNNGVEILYTPNTINQTFELYYVFEMGRNHNKKLPLAIDYLEYLGTENYSAEEFKEEMYKLGASYSVSSGSDQVYVRLSGLSENMEQSMQLFEQLINQPKPNEEALSDMIDDILKKRADAKQNPQNVFSHLVMFGLYGKDNPVTNIIEEKDLKSITGQELIAILKDLKNYKHKVLYYGNKPLAQVKENILDYHSMGKNLKQVEDKDYIQKENRKDRVYYVDFDTPQSMILMTSRSQKFNKELLPTIKLYNTYFGQGMKSIVFQEMREKRSLAYTALSMYQNPDETDKYHSNLAFIATSYEKIDDAIGGLTDLQNNMPKEEKSFELAKNGIMEEMQTEWITQSSILFNYLAAQKLGYDYDKRKDLYNALPELSFEDIKEFQNKYISNQPKTIVILGRKDDLDKKVLKKYGKVKKMKMKDIFGY
ncbi:MAG: insulinase family protein [Bacteroidales bacterium]